MVMHWNEIIFHGKHVNCVKLRITLGNLLEDNLPQNLDSAPSDLLQLPFVFKMTQFPVTPTFEINVSQWDKH
jgi:hypothetical protein